VHVGCDYLETHQSHIFVFSSNPFSFFSLKKKANCDLFRNFGKSTREANPRKMTTLLCALSKEELYLYILERAEKSLSDYSSAKAWRTMFRIDVDEWAERLQWMQPPPSAMTRLESFRTQYSKAISGKTLFTFSSKTETKENIDVKIECGHQELLYLPVVLAFFNIERKGDKDLPPNDMQTKERESAIISVTSAEKASAVNKFLDGMLYLQRKNVLLKAIQSGELQSKLNPESHFYRGDGKLKPELIDGWPDAPLYLLTCKDYGLDHLLQAWPFPQDGEVQDVKDAKLKMYRQILFSPHTRVAFESDAIQAAKDHQEYLDVFILEWMPTKYVSSSPRWYVYNLRTLQTVHKYFVANGKTNADFAEMFLTGCSICLTSPDLVAMVDFIWSLPNTDLPMIRNETALIAYLKKHDRYNGWGNTHNSIAIFIKCGYLEWTPQQIDAWIARDNLDDGDRTLRNKMVEAFGSEDQKQRLEQLTSRKRSREQSKDSGDDSD